MTRGYFGIGIIGGKTAANVGTLWRSAGCMGASFIFTAGHRYPRQASDTIKAWRHIPLISHRGEEEFWDSGVPYDCVPVAIELSEKAKPLATYKHPERAIYILGAEDNGVPKATLWRCRDVIEIPSEYCLNVAVAGSIVMYDRNAKKLVA